MKHWKKGLCGLLAAVLMAPAGLAAPVNERLVRFGRHWAQKVEGRGCIWMGGQLDGSF